ncbi:hypothetical protein L202_02874 [Cryptococcus amylolentus CBS 6039]|uniref:Uncharacterized protein n=2 Tax=Cryptococcus amylolentus TaxID=104669 RepID=A0A1E3HWQ0_9TREE|nr:hypothetical protein L202_02874 [Cryptococcus amylolentus CBS 6039]ODN80709.1 hypothetical protein L202_02874 [Cryptococcus amylolentus CBS 6039]
MDATVGTNTSNLELYVIMLDVEHGVNDPTRAAYRKSENDLLPAERALVSDF